MALGSIELVDELLRGHRAVRIFTERGNLVPVQLSVETHTEPSPGANIRGPEEPVGH